MRQECDGILAFIQQYKATCEQYFEDMYKKVASTRFGVGGELLHRGVLCPSIIKDIVCGNVTRGKINKNPPNTKKEYYEYGFDQDEHLIVVIKHGKSTEYEWIIYMGSTQLGITFVPEFGIQYVSVCHYNENNCLLDYSFYNYLDYDDSIIYYEKEVYVDRISELIVDCYEQCCTQDVSNHTTFCFKKDNCGWLTSYVARNECKEVGNLPLQEFKVLKKRKYSYL